MLCKWKHVSGRHGCYSEVYSQSAHLYRNVVGFEGVSH